MWRQSLFALTIQNNSQRSILGLLASGLQHVRQELLRHGCRRTLFADHEERLTVAVAERYEDSQRDHCLELRHGDVMLVSHPRLQLLGAATL